MTKVFNTAQGVALATAAGLAVWIGAVWVAFGVIA
jgi:hypothetical protein